MSAKYCGMSERAFWAFHFAFTRILGALGIELFPRGIRILRRIASGPLPPRFPMSSPTRKRDAENIFTSVKRMEQMAERVFNTIQNTGSAYRKQAMNSNSHFSPVRDFDSPDGYVNTQVRPQSGYTLP